jgi:hypothetical protein
MSFTENEVRFLMKPHQGEHATGNRPLLAVTDLRALGCPARIFERILESRARKLGRKFQEFRTSNEIAPAPNGEVVPLELEAANAKLW